MSFDFSSGSPFISFVVMGDITKQKAIFFSMKNKTKTVLKVNEINTW